MTLEDVRLARALPEEAEIADLLDLWMALQEVAHLRCILASAAHAHFKRLEAPEQHPRRVRVADRADRVAHHPDFVDQLPLANEAARNKVAVPADIFGQAVDREVGAVAQ